MYDILYFVIYVGFCLLPVLFTILWLQALAQMTFVYIYEIGECAVCRCCMGCIGPDNLSSLIFIPAARLSIDFYFKWNILNGWQRERERVGYGK